MTTKDVRIGRCTVHVLPVIKGLTSETNKVKEAFDYLHPDRVAISISKEELEGLKAMPDDYQPELSRYEELYVQGLSRFGEVAAPPPCYVAALELADHTGVPLIPVDLDEEHYTELYCAAVPGRTLFLHSTRTWILKRRDFGADTAERFVKAWDKAVNHLEGFDVIEKKRAEAMANGIVSACDGSTHLLAVIELERAADVIALLEKRGS